MRYSLGFILAISLAGLQFVAIITVVLTTYVSTETAMLKHARGLLHDASDAAIERSIRFLEPAAEATEISAKIIEAGIVSGSDPAALEAFLFQYMQNAPQFSGIFYGDEAGNFVFVMRETTPGEFRSKIVQNGAAVRSIEFIWRDADFNVLRRSFDPTDTFDPRARPWYINAKSAPGNVWTDPYIFFSSQNPGISVSTSVMGPTGTTQGVIGVDIEIAAISSFLSDLNISDESAALILNDNGDIIAHPDLDQTRVRNADGTLDFAHIDHIDDPALRAAFSDLSSDGWSPNQDIESKFRYMDAPYLMLVSPITGIDLPWTIAIIAPENDFIAGIKANRQRNIWIAAIISLITALAGLTLAELILRPVRAFAVRTALVSQGEVSATAPLPGTYRELSKANQTLIKEIAQRRESEEKIQELSRDLSHFSRVNLMGQMATGLAHELSQPLTAITQNIDSAISTANDLAGDKADLLHLLHELDEQAHRSGDVIHTLRGLVRKDEGQTDAFDFNELLSQTRRLMRLEAEPLGIDIIATSVDLPDVIGNRVQIAQVLINLMRNAIEAICDNAQTGGKITITPVLRADHIEVQVADNGPGIAPGITLFKRFQTSKPGGMGLGLTICQGIIETNGGKLWYDAASQTKGLATGRFCFTLPTKMDR